MYITELLSPLVDYIKTYRIPKEPDQRFDIYAELDCCGAAGAYYRLKKDEKYWNTKDLRICIRAPCDWNEVSFSKSGGKGGKWTDY